MSPRWKIAAALVCPISVAICALAQDRAAVADHLRSSLVGQTVTLRTFDKAERLEFDSSGIFLLRADPASWTTSAKLRVEKVEIRPQEILIRGKRLIVLFDNDKKMKLIPTKDKREVLIRFLQGNIDQSSADSAIQHVFLAPVDHLSDIVPPYWREFVATNIDGLNVPIHGLSTVSEQPSPPPASAPLGSASSNSTPLPPAESLFQISRNSKITGPKAIYSPDPGYSEEARSLNYQGTVSIWIEIGTDGKVHDPIIDRALGAGLDDAAIEAVKQWRFTPATKNGQPVAVRTMIETSFHMY